MLVAWFVASLFYLTGQCQNLASSHLDDDPKLIQCVIDVLNKYFSEQFELTYVTINPDDSELLKAIHSTVNISVITRNPIHTMFVPNQAYLIISSDVASFTKYFKFLTMEAAWNPYARFLIITRSLRDIGLRLIFDELLKQHVNNALVVNGTEDAHLYTYNPFDKFACGRYYNSVISYGLCLQTTHDLFPNKLINGLKNCSFRGSLAHRPPFSIDPLQTDGGKVLLGSEEYIINLLGEEEQFTVTFNYSYNAELFSTIEPNMTAIGPMEMLQNNQTDIIFGGMMMVASRAEAFTYLCGYHDYSDELRFAVKSASLVSIWKYIYLEFEFDVWGVLLVSFVVYSMIIIILLRPKDGGAIVLRLLDNLLLHGREISTRLSVKCVLITWLWFAYLINTFYQSSLFSLTTQPGTEFQVADEEDMVKYELKPCFSHALRKFLFTETNKLSKTGSFQNDGCTTTVDAMYTVSHTYDMFTLVPNYYYLYNERHYKDKWGEPLVYYFDKPYAKFLFGYFFYKGFPITRSLKLNALRMRESGIADKSLNDHYYVQRLKQRFSQKTFETRFLFPWWVCIPGLIVSTVTFIIEVLIKHLNRFRCNFS